MIYQVVHSIYYVFLKILHTFKNGRKSTYSMSQDFLKKIETYEAEAALVILLLLVFIDAQRVPFHYVSELCCHHQRDKL